MISSQCADLSGQSPLPPTLPPPGAFVQVCSWTITCMSRATQYTFLGLLGFCTLTGSSVILKEQRGLRTKGLRIGSGQRQNSRGIHREALKILYCRCSSLVVILLYEVAVKRIQKEEIAIRTLTSIGRVGLCLSDQPGPLQGLLERLKIRELQGQMVTSSPLRKQARMVCAAWKALPQCGHCSPSRRSPGNSGIGDS